MKVHSNIQTQGRQAFLAKRSLSDNPFQYVGGVAGRAKQAAWSAGWKKQQKESG